MKARSNAMKTNCKRVWCLHGYRSQLLPMSELEQLQKNQNELITMNSFLSATIQFKVAELYSTPIDQLDATSTLQSVYFIIDVYNLSREMTPFALIENHACNPDESEVLFSIGAIFKVKSIESHNNIWYIYLELSKEQNKLGQNWLDHMLEQFKSEPGPLAFGWFLFRMNQFDKVERYAKWMIQQLPSNDIAIGDAHNLLGLIYKDRNKLDRSIQSYDKALDIYSHLGYQNSCRAIAVHCNLGLAHLALDDWRSAEDQHTQAEEKFTLLPTNYPLLKSHVDRLKAKLMENSGYAEEALKKLEKVLENRRKTLDPNHPSIGTTLNDIGSVYDKTDNHIKALEYFQQALDIGKKSLTSDHLEFVDYYMNVGRMYHKFGRFKLAYEQFELAQKVLLEYDRNEEEKIAQLHTLMTEMTIKMH
ncbi:unnamed protein product [Rotaria sp. Silwood2]|nr:unnamed protein product [Rotaria sp. Silwood2]CAF3126597.1 unnamed protein product [Rotaria sp. Silwood2]CAF4147627.1 unnamed protein product [Rotaria sp. Silwood2]CAF4294883.1 unnamed protein product [Rotaria sp. Silwood2]